MRSALILILFIITIPVIAQEESESLQIGDAISEIELPNTYGQIINIAEDVDKAICIIFTNHQCNYALLYLDRIIALQNQYAPQGIKFVLIESRIESFEGSTQSLEEFISDRNLNMEYVIDLSNTLSKRFGAQSSPHTFLLRNSGSELIVSYSGSIDNNSRKPERATRNYLDDAIKSVLSGEELIKAKTKAIGCYIDKG